MAKILRRSGEVEETRRALQYDWEGEQDSGFLFDCDEHGNPVNPSEAARENYLKCVSNTHARKVVFRGIRTFTSHYHQPSLLKCDCGAELELDNPMTNHCHCGRMFNSAGQLLSHPRFWGEETGERFDDRGSPVL